MRGSWSDWVMRVGVLLLLGLLFGLSAATVGAEEEPDPARRADEYGARALLAEDDAGLRRIYDGVRKGLEQAHLPRVQREDLDDEGKVLERLEKDPPDLLFVIGRVAAERLGTRMADVPRVYVDTAWSVNAEPLPAPPQPKPPAAVVRSAIKAVHVAEILRDLGLGRPHACLSWTPTTPALQTATRNLAAAAGFRYAEGDDVEVLLHLRLGLGEEPVPLAESLARARAHGLFLLSDDLAHWRQGVPILVLPDHKLLGRVAADAGRLLLHDSPKAVIQRLVAAREIRVDLGAARALGLELPVPFLAGADVLRGAPRRAPEESQR